MYEDIIADYNTGNYTQKQLASKYRRSKQNISEILIKAGIRQNRKFTQSEIELILSDKPKNEISLYLNISNEELWALICYYRRKQCSQL